MSYPTNDEILQLLESSFKKKIQTDDLKKKDETLFQFGDLETMFADDVEVHINGHDFHLGGKHTGIESHTQADDMPSLSAIIDVEKPINGKVTHVIGSEKEDYRALVLHSTATTNNGKPWNHEMVVLLRFNTSKKITEFRAYADTQHVHDHIKAQV